MSELTNPRFLLRVDDVRRWASRIDNPNYQWAKGWLACYEELVRLELGKVDKPIEQDAPFESNPVFFSRCSSEEFLRRVRKTIAAESSEETAK